MEQISEALSGAVVPLIELPAGPDFVRFAVGRDEREFKQAVPAVLILAENNFDKRRSRGVGDDGDSTDFSAVFDLARRTLR